MKNLMQLFVLFALCLSLPTANAQYYETYRGLRVSGYTEVEWRGGEPLLAVVHTAGTELVQATSYPNTPWPGAGYILEPVAVQWVPDGSLACVQGGGMYFHHNDFLIGCVEPINTSGSQPGSVVEMQVAPIAGTWPLDAYGDAMETLNLTGAFQWADQGPQGDCNGPWVSPNENRPPLVRVLYRVNVL